MTDLVIYAVAIYGGLGALVAIPFLAVDVSEVVDEARGSSPFFRLLVLPGCIALWPVVLRKWLGATKGGTS